MPTATTNPTTGFAVSLAISDERMGDMLVGAFEGGSNYWIDRVDVRLRDGLTSRSPELYDPKSRVGENWQQIYAAPFVRGCWLEVFANEKVEPPGLPPSKGPYLLNRERIQRGLEIMAAGCTPEQLKSAGNDYLRRHLFDFINEKDDATTADVILQVCLFGDTIFG